VFFPSQEILSMLPIVVSFKLFVETWFLLCIKIPSLLKI
jgi:hypothetical protein